MRISDLSSDLCSSYLLVRILSLLPSEIKMKKVLVLSAHGFSIDRIIIAQLNTLIDQNYEVVLLTVPIQDDFKEVLSPSIRIIREPLKQASLKDRKSTRLNSSH